MKHLLATPYVLLSLLILLSPSITQADCGSITYIEQVFGGTTGSASEPIVDCDNPFAADEVVGYEPQLVINGIPVADGDTITLEPEQPLSFEPTITPAGYGSDYYIDIYQKTAAGYQQLNQGLGIDYFLDGLPAGDYTVVYVSENLFQSSNPPTWLDTFKKLLLPATAHAFSQYPGYAEVTTINFSIAHNSPAPTGASSVLFLPGIQASRLYAGEDITLPGLPNNVERGDTLWEQTNDKRIALLAMDETGQSVYDIYTQDVVEEVTGLSVGANIYKGFLQMLEDLKVDVDSFTGTTTITDYVPFAYDWRYSVFDVATEPVQYENETKLLKDEVLRLADGSHTGMVTIVAHSNGGLVAKALLHEYGDNELQDKVDKVIMIGTPQLGTPKGMSALLHGQVMEGFGNLLTSDTVLRDTIRNMPGTYTLLPSTRYLDEVADEPLIRVPDGFDLNVYDGVSNRSELDELLLDSQNVVGSTPTIQEPMQLNSNLLSESLVEQAILDEWQPPADVEVYEVAGTGIPTVAAIHYEVVPVTTCPNAAAVFLGFQCSTAMGLKPKLETTVNGDKTVVLGSARGQLGDKRTLTVDLVEEGDGVFAFEREHADLTESPAVQTFLESVIRFPYVTDDIVTPEFSQLLSGYTIHAGHSPVTLRVTTPDGLVTGIVDGEVREDISGSQFLTLAGSSYVIIPDDVTDYRLEVIGTGNGVYTLETSTLSPEDVQTVIASFVASTTDMMLATMEVTGGELGNLQTDFDGDGEVDEVRTSTGDLVVMEVVEEELETQSSAESQSSATRVGDRTPASRVLGVSVSADTLSAGQLEQLQTLLIDVQRILQQDELTPEELVVLSSVLRQALFIINN